MFGRQRLDTWSVTAFRQWFDEFVTTAEARSACVNAARRVGATHLSDDLAQEWWLSMRGTLDRLDARNATMPEWIGDDTAARRYAFRALNNRAVDLVRTVRPTVALDVDVRDGSTMPASASLGHVSGTRVDHSALPADGHAEPSAAAERLLMCDQWARTIMFRRDAGLIVHHGCRTDLLVQMLLTIVEWVRDDKPFAAADVRGGSSEWDRLVYAALEATDPSRWAGVSTNPANRQRKGRYGRAARHELELLVAAGRDERPTSPVTTPDRRRP